MAGLRKVPRRPAGLGAYRLGGDLSALAGIAGLEAAGPYANAGLAQAMRAAG